VLAQSTVRNILRAHPLQNKTGQKQVLDVSSTQWRLRLTIYVVEREFDYSVFVPPPTSLINKVVNSGSSHWALSLFIYFRSMSGSRVHVAGPEP